MRLPKRRPAAGVSRAAVLAVLVALAAASIVVIRSLRQARQAALEDALLARHAATLAPKVHLLGELAPSVAYAIETSAGLVLIDSGLEADAATLLEQLATLDLDASQITAILLTHVHGDHVLGARFLREMTGARIYAGQGDCTELRDGGPREAFFSTFPMEQYTVHGTPVDVELQGGERLDFGDAQIEVLATPGHTPGSVCYLLEQGGRRVLFGGDTISSLIAGLGTYAAHLAPRYRGNARDYLNSLRRLRGMAVPDLVLPGHPNEQGRPHSPRLSESQWHELLDRGIREMETLVARYQADGEDFLDGNPKQVLTGLYYLGDYRGRAVYVLIEGDHQVLFDAHGDEDLPGFVEQRLQELAVDAPAITDVLVTSADPESGGGLQAVARTWDCRVVADPSAHEAIAAGLPDERRLMTPQAWAAEQDWIQIQSIPLSGCCPGAVVWLLRCDDRRVLVSGDVPSTLSKSSTTALIKALSGRRRQGLRNALEMLRAAKPQVWLPARPKNGQNANLYDEQWDAVLLGNLRLGG